jgi:uncharacterized protein YjbI with pentapeptide repeats
MRPVVEGWSEYGSYEKEIIRRVPVSAWVIGGTTLALVLILIGYAYGITLWDWLQLLVVPAVLAGGGLWFNWVQKKHEQTLATQRTQDDALQSYLEHMGELLVDEKLRNSKEDDEARTLARARTLTVLARLDPKGKRSVLQFLYESKLISKEQTVVKLCGDDLRSGAVLRLAVLSHDDPSLGGADLSGADLRNAVLKGANLSGVNLIDANLVGANLIGTDLSGANLRGANFSDANMIGVNLYGADMIGANLCGAYMNGAELSCADLRRANLYDTNLRHVNLSYANLDSTNLSYANMDNTNLSNAVLS